MPRSQDLAIFVPTRQRRNDADDYHFTPCACARGNNYLCNMLTTLYQSYLRIQLLDIWSRFILKFNLRIYVGYRCMLLLLWTYWCIIPHRTYRDLPARRWGVIFIITPRACARGKAIVSVVVVGTKIARSRVLGIYACCKHNQSVDIGAKLVCTRFELLKKA